MRPHMVILILLIKLIQAYPFSKILRQIVPVIRIFWPTYTIRAWPDGYEFKIDFSSSL